VIANDGRSGLIEQVQGSLKYQAKDTATPEMTNVGGKRIGLRHEKKNAIGCSGSTAITSI